MFLPAHSACLAGGRSESSGRPDEGKDAMESQKALGFHCSPCVFIGYINTLIDFSMKIDYIYFQWLFLKP